MAFPAIHRPHAIKLPASTYITQFTDVRYNNQYAEIMERSTSEVQPQHTGAFGAVPVIEFGSRQIKDILDECTDTAISRAYTAGTTILYYRKGLNRGTREDVAVGDTVHDRFDMLNSAFLYWQSLSAEQRGYAEIEASIMGVSTDGLTAPILHVGSAELSAAVSAVGHLFTLGSWTVNGALIDSVKAVSIQNNLTVTPDDGSGNDFPEYAEIEDSSPRIVIDTNDIGIFNDYGEEGVALTSMSGYFRKMSKGSSGPILDATAEHIKFTATDGTIFATEGSGTKARFQVVILLSKPDATTDAYTINTAIAVT